MNIKNSISDMLFPMMGRLLIRWNKYINVIYYHDIIDGENEGCMRMNVDTFFSQMDYIYQKGYETIRFDDLSNPECLKYKKKRVLITFDDGWVSNYSNIFEYMSRHCLKYNVFLAAGLVGNDSNYLSWEMVRKMHDSGLVGFGAHTFNHVDMQDLLKIDVKEEILRTNETLKKEIGYTPQDFCYPYGYYSEASNNELLSKFGYKRVYTSKQMYSYDLNDGIVMGRNPIDSSESNTVFVNELKGLYNCYSLLRHFKNK